MVAFLIWFPVPLSKNVSAYALGYALFFSVKTLGLFTLNLRGMPAVAQGVSLFTILTVLLCYGYWIYTLRREGENIPVVLGHSWNPASQQRLSQQLQAINASLMRTAGK